MPTVTSRTGLVSVDTTDQGLPNDVRIDPAGLRSDPQKIAAEIVQACRRARLQGQVARRAELAAAGVSPEVLAAMGLASVDDVAAAELADDLESDGRSTWMRGL
jgi:hypothetical protein